MTRLLHQGEVPVALDLQGINCECRGKELGLILGMAEGDTEPNDIMVGVGEGVAFKLCLTEVHLLELVRRSGNTLGGDLVQSVILNLTKSVQSAGDIPGYDLVNNRLSPC